MPGALMKMNYIVENARNQVKTRDFYINQALPVRKHCKTDSVTQQSKIFHYV